MPPHHIDLAGRRRFMQFLAASFLPKSVDAWDIYAKARFARLRSW
jgi:hypothetical protein